MSTALDTNILVYTLHPAAEPRRARARDLMIRSMRQGTTIVPLQALAEFADVATRKLRIDPDAVRRRIDAWREVLLIERVVELDLIAALESVRDHKSRFWDALPCATAARAGAQYLLCEDMQDGRLLRGLRIVNPFHSRNDDLVDRLLPL